MKKFKYKINGKEYEVAVDKMEETQAEVTVNGTSYTVELEKPKVEESAPKIQRPVSTGASASKPSAGSSAGSVKSPLPGIIVDIKVKAGDEVKKGQVIAILEAMKMENNIASPIDGKVTEINVNPGDSVLEGVTILTIA